MGFSGVSVSELLIILLIVILLFGSKHVKSLGADLGGAIRGFRKAMEGRESDEPARSPSNRPVPAALEQPPSEVTPAPKAAPGVTPEKKQ